MCGVHVHVYMHVYVHVYMYAQVHSLSEDNALCILYMLDCGCQVTVFSLLPHFTCTYMYIAWHSRCVSDATGHKVRSGRQKGSHNRGGTQGTVCTGHPEILVA